MAQAVQATHVLSGDPCKYYVQQKNVLQAWTDSGTQRAVATCIFSVARHSSGFSKQRPYAGKQS